MNTLAMQRSGTLALISLSPSSEFAVLQILILAYSLWIGLHSSSDGPAWSGLAWNQAQPGQTRPGACLGLGLNRLAGAEKAPQTQALASSSPGKPGQAFMREKGKQARPDQAPSTGKPSKPCKSRKPSLRPSPRTRSPVASKPSQARPGHLNSMIILQGLPRRRVRIPIVSKPKVAKSKKKKSLRA